MARIKLAYVGGGSTRGAGTMASFIHHRGADFDGSEIVLIDLDPARLGLVEVIARKMARARGLDIEITLDDRPSGRSRLDATPCSPASAPAGSRRVRSTSERPTATA